MKNEIDIAKDHIRTNWSILLLAWVTGIGVLSALGAASYGWSELEGSVWMGIAKAAHFYIFVLGWCCFAPSLRIYVSHGVTRRVIAKGSVIFGVVVSFGVSVLFLIGLGLERLALTMTDVSQFDSKEIDLLGTIPTMAALFVQFFVTGFCFFIAGYFVGLGYGRFKFIGGTLLLPITGFPLIGAWAMNVIFQAEGHWDITINWLAIAGITIIGAICTLPIVKVSRNTTINQVVNP